MSQKIISEQILNLEKPTIKFTLNIKSSGNFIPDNLNSNYNSLEVIKISQTPVLIEISKKMKLNK